MVLILLRGLPMTLNYLDLHLLNSMLLHDLRGKMGRNLLQKILILCSGMSGFILTFLLMYKCYKMAHECNILDFCHLSFF